MHKSIYLPIVIGCVLLACSNDTKSSGAVEGKNTDADSDSDTNTQPLTGTGTSTGTGNDSDTSSVAVGATDSDTNTSADTHSDGETDSGSDATGNGGTMTPTDFCRDGWCHENPLPSGSDYTGVWVNSPTDVWLCNSNGEILHTDGTVWNAWRTEKSPEIFRALWGTGPSDMYAVSNRRVMRFDGQRWSEIFNQSGGSDIIGFDTGDLWLAGLNAIYHWNTQSWETIENATTGIISSIFGTSNTDIWVGSADGTIFHYNGSEWTAFPTDASPVSDIWGPSADNIYFTKTGSTLHHWNGTELSVIDPGFSDIWDGISGVSANDIWLAGRGGRVAHFDGELWTSDAPSAGLRGFSDIHATVNAPVWMAGPQGHYCTLDDGTWDCTETLTIQTLLSVSGESRNDMTAMGPAGPELNRDASGWHPSALSSTRYFQDFWPVGANGVWATPSGNLGTDMRLSHWDGATWTDTTVAVPSGFVNVSIASDGTAWAIDEAHKACFFDGAQWGCEVLSSGYQLNDIFYNGEAAWAAGDNGLVIMHDGTGWNVATGGDGADLYAIWGSSGSDLWAVGRSGDAIHFDGTTWSPMDISGAYDLNDVFGFAPDDVWTVSRLGGIYHFDGVKWTEVLESNRDYYHIWGLSSDDVWAVGQTGQIAHWDGMAFTEHPQLGHEALTGVGGTGTDNLWITGEYGTLYRNTGGGWQEVTNFMTQSEVSFSGVQAAANGEVWITDSHGRLWIWDGTWWSRYGLSSNVVNISQITATSATDAWAALNDGAILHYDGIDWTQQLAPGPLRLDAIHAKSPNEVWAIGDVLMAYDGTHWTPLVALGEIAQNRRFIGVFGESNNQIQGLLQDGTIVHWDGSSISQTSHAVIGNEYNAVWWAAYNDFWAVGYQGAILHFEAGQFIFPAPITSTSLLSITGTTEGDLFAVGWNGTVLRRSPQ